VSGELTRLSWPRTCDADPLASCRHGSPPGPYRCVLALQRRDGSRGWETRLDGRRCSCCQARASGDASGTPTRTRPCVCARALSCNRVATAASALSCVPPTLLLGSCELWPMNSAKPSMDRPLCPHCGHVGVWPRTQGACPLMASPAGWRWRGRRLGWCERARCARPASRARAGHVEGSQP